MLSRKLLYLFFFTKLITISIQDTVLLPNIGFAMDLSSINDPILPNAINFAKQKFLKKYNKDIGAFYNANIEVTGGTNYILIFNDTNGKVNKVVLNHRPWLNQFQIVEL